MKLIQSQLVAAQLTLTIPRDAVRHADRAVSTGGRSV